MNGIQGLMGGGQGPMPGQAPQQPMPGMMQQQSAPTPGAMVSQLSAMPFEQLAQFYSNPRPQSPPLWAVISAIAEKQKQAKAMQMAHGQQVMAQNQQMQAQPPVAAEVVMSAENTPGMEEQDTVMAALGGMMHSYAGGGAVAFKDGGNAAVQRILQKSPYERTPEENEILRAAGIELTRKSLPQEGGVSALNKALESPFLRRMFTGDTYKLSPEELAKRTDTGAITERMFRALGGSQFVEPTPAPADTSKLFPFGPPESPMLEVPEIQIRPPSASSGQRRQPTAQKPPAAGIAAALQEQPPTPAIDARAAAAAAEQQAMQRAGQVTPEEIAARQGIDKLLGASASSFEEERKRRSALEEQRMQEALGRYKTPGYKDIVGIGSLLKGMKGAKTFYEGAVGAGAAAGDYQAAKEAALRAAEQKFDLSGKEMFELNRLQQQVQMDQAKLAEARASGDAQRSVKAAMDVAQSQKQLAEYQTELGLKREKMALEGRDTASRETQARAAMASASREPEIIRTMRTLGIPLTPEGFKEISSAKTGLEDKLEAKKQELMSKDPMYKLARMEYINETDPAKKANALRKMREIEALNGIVDAGAAPSATQIPPGVTVKKVGP